jgi:hypothetical protein
MNNLFRGFIFALLLSFQLILAQTISQNYWQDVEYSQIVPVGQRYIFPQLYRTIKLDVE